MDTDKPMKEPSAWQPMNDKHNLAVLGKLLEELGEATSAASRCIIQGLNESDPETFKPNIDWLQEELADVRALTLLAIEHFKLNEMAMVRRCGRKLAHKRAWLLKVHP